MLTFFADLVFFCPIASLLSAVFVLQVPLQRGQQQVPELAVQLARLGRREAGACSQSFTDAVGVLKRKTPVVCMCHGLDRVANLSRPNQTLSLF